MDKHRICFVAPLARPILEPGFRCDFGGAEVRAVNFARGLAADPAFEVSMILRSYRRESPRQIGHLNAYFEPAEKPIVRIQELSRNKLFLANLLKVKLQKLRRSLAKRFLPDTRDAEQQRLIAEIPAKTVACFGVHQYSAQCFAAAKKANKRSLLFIAHDQDLDFEKHRSIAEAYGGDVQSYRQVIELADHLVCQTVEQQQLLRSHFGRDGVVVRNPIDLSAQAEVKADGGEYILWVGRAETFFKRADKMLELARRSPEIPFVAIMNKRKLDVFRDLVSQAPSNVRIIEHVPYQEIESYYANATALLSTSLGEGFPNAFLQAGKYGQPILSLDVDPGAMIGQHRCGVITHGDMEVMAEELKRMWRQRNDEYRRSYSQSIRRYVETYHDQAGRIEELRQFVEAISTAAFQPANRGHTSSKTAA